MRTMKSKLMSLFVLLVLFVFASAAYSTTPPMPAGADKLIAKRNAMLDEARKVLPQISVADLKKMVDAKENIIIIDVRDPDEWVAGIVDFPGSITISRGMLEFRAPARVGSQERIFIICKAGHRSLFATKALMDLGYAHVTSVIGGVDAWTAAGFPLKKQ